MSDFEDSGKWGPGAQSAAGRQRDSDATTKHGGRALTRAMYGEIKFRASHIDMINRAMIDLQTDEAAAIEFLRGASYVLVMRFLAATEASDDLPTNSLMNRLRLATGLYETFDKACKALQAADNNVIDYEDLLNDNG